MNIFQKVITSATLAALVMGCSATMAGNAPSLPNATPESFKYVGAFRISNDTYGSSRIAATSGKFAIDLENNSFYVAGHRRYNHIAEFPLPIPSDSSQIDSLPISGPAKQNFVSVLDRAPSGNPDGINTITGLYLHKGSLLVNGIEYYDGNVNATDTTLVIKSPRDLESSVISGFHKLEGAAHAAGWVSEVPTEWQAALSATHLLGHSSGWPINARLSIGPTAFGFNPDHLLSATSVGAPINTNPFLDFSLSNKLHEDLANESRTNNLWTFLSKADYGFIVPQSNTYVTFGSSAGHISGVGYKSTRDDGSKCEGYCAYDRSDYYSYVWFWNVSDFVKVKSGAMAPHELKPYSFGKIDLPFKNEATGYSPIIGGDYVAETGKLYLMLADAEPGRYENKPVMVVYEVLPPRSKPGGPESVVLEVVE